jgi:hypothetical protein
MGLHENKSPESTSSVQYHSTDMYVTVLKELKYTINKWYFHRSWIWIPLVDTYNNIFRHEEHIILEMTRGSQPLQPTPLIEVRLRLTSQYFSFCQFSYLPSPFLANETAIDHVCIYDFGHKCKGGSLVM